MDSVILDILDALRNGSTLDAAALDRIIRAHSARAHDGRRIFAKKNILPRYLAVKGQGGPVWESWAVDDQLDAAFVRTLQMKPRRSASGVATITVITKPWPCKSACLYCPNDIRMPKSYLCNEPACQRAERNWFDPYLQTASRLNTLEQMGHATDKVEVIVLGGTWSDYPESYRLWFSTQLFRALNDDGGTRSQRIERLRSDYRDAGLHNEPDAIEQAVAPVQKRIVSGELSYNEAWQEVYAHSEPWSIVADRQTASWEELTELQSANERADHRMVGLVIETRPDAISVQTLTELRRMGCTKVQMGVQSLRSHILARNGRAINRATIANAFELTRLFGFKSHAHFMVNLLDMTPAMDKIDYRLLMTMAPFKPDEVKLYPLALVEGTKLVDCYHDGSWRPYTEEELLDVLTSDLVATPAYTRISRMIRDISADDILVGNKKTNLRQLVENGYSGKLPIREIRFREIGTSEIDLDNIELDVCTYTTSNTIEHFLQWVTPENKIVGFLRLSLPNREALEQLGELAPVHPDSAMIREVHVYGFATHIHQGAAHAQHRGLGTALIERACEIARDSGYSALNVISAVGTREYYRNRGFSDNGLYQTRAL